jgi:hypothetical protein
MPNQGDTRWCSKHGVNEKYCTQHGCWEFYCSVNETWYDTDRLTKTSSGSWRCPCGRTFAQANDDIDELFDRAKAAYRRESSSERHRIVNDQNYAYDWVQGAIGFLTAILNFFSAVWSANCYITTAVVDYLGLPDDCKALTVLRRFRDTYIVAGGDPSDNYYRVAPTVVNRLSLAPDRELHLASLAATISEAVEEIEAGRNDNAYNLYKTKILTLARALGVTQ